MSESTRKEKSGKRLPSTAWKPGESGNPGGRPAGLRALIAGFEKFGPKVMQRLLELTASDDEKVARAACVDFLDRIYGKPTQPVAGDPDRPPVGGLIDAALLRDPGVVSAVHAALLREPGSDGGYVVSRPVAPGAASDTSGGVDR